MKFTVLCLMLASLSVSTISLAKSQRKINKRPKETPTTRQLHGEKGSFKGSQTIASLPRVVGR